MTGTCVTCKYMGEEGYIADWQFGGGFYRHYCNHPDHRNSGSGVHEERKRDFCEYHNGPFKTCHKWIKRKNGIGYEVHAGTFRKPARGVPCLGQTL